MTDDDKVASVSISVDVPNIKEGVRFYSAAFGFSQLSEPVPGVVVMSAGNTTISLLEKGVGSKPSIYAKDVRHYERHWTPVHLDIHVDNLTTALERAIKSRSLRTRNMDLRGFAAIHLVMASAFLKRDGDVGLAKFPRASDRHQNRRTSASGQYC